MQIAEKRYDIQGLRAWAVIAVVVFHFFPSILPFGYLGVDVFFVLSGYLISLVLDNKAISQLSTYTNFYFKRIRRIFPLLLLIVFICSIYTVLCYSEVLFLYSEKSALYAGLFITNLKGNNEGEDYFRDLEQADDLYTHTWSLSVEIQFYLVAPLLLHVLKPSGTDSFTGMTYLLVIACSSFAYSIVLPSSAFYSTIARLWQFTTGAIAFRLQKTPTLPIQKIHPTESPNTYIFMIYERMDIAVSFLLALSLIIGCAVFNYWEFSLRCSVTFLCASLLVVKLTTPLLTHSVLQVIGDSSYALYLIHWLVVCILRFYKCDQWPIQLISMFLCFAAAVLVYEIYEKWYLTLNIKWTFILIGCLYLASLAVYLIYICSHPEATEIDDMDTPRSYEEARILNQHMDSQWEKYLRLKDCTFRDSSDRNPWGFCNLPPGNGSLSFLVIGNSYAANHGRLIVENLKEHYGRIAIHTVSECEPLIETKNYYCTDAVKLQEGFLNDIDTYKPDVLFLSARYIEPNVPIVSDNVEDDALYKSMMEKLKRYEAKVKKVFILDAFPRTANLQKVEDARIKAGKSIEGYMEEVIEADSIPMRRRVEEIAKHCKKCVVYDLMQMHMVNGTFRVTNPETHLHYFEALRHHTPVGLKLVEPLYRKLSDNFDDLMNSTSPNNILA